MIASRVVAAVIVAVIGLASMARCGGKADSTGPDYIDVAVNDVSDVSADAADVAEPAMAVVASDLDRVGPFPGYPTGAVLDELLVTSKPTATEVDVVSLASSIGGTIIGRVDPIRLWQIRIKNPALDGKYLQAVLRVVKQRTDVVEAAFPNAGTGVLRYPNECYGANGSADDCSTGAVWESTDVRNKTWGQWAIDLPGAWDWTVGSKALTIGVVDVSLDASHPDFENRLTLRYGESGTSSHGTHVAGILGATGDNHRDVTGANWTSLINGYVIDGYYKSNDEYFFCLDSTTTAISQTALVRAIREGNRIINASIGYNWHSNELKCELLDIQLWPIDRSVYPYDGATEDGYPTADWIEEQKAAWRPALELARKKDALIVLGSGNNSDPSVRWVDAKWSGGLQALAPEYPDNVIVVASVGDPSKNFNSWASRWNALSTYSSVGIGVEIAAPGAMIFSTVPCKDGKCAGYSSGTSMAAPFVAGAASLVWSLRSGLTAKDVKKILLESARTAGKQVVKLDGNQTVVEATPWYVLNAAEAVRMALAFPPGPNDPQEATQCVDSDHDGYGVRLPDGSVPSDCKNKQPDCDDTDGQIHPGATERCNDRDDNCNAHVDEEGVCCFDADEDGYPSMECGGNDCNDYKASVHPGANEFCDLVDTDCDGILDNVPATRLEADSANCGSCGHACTSESPYCYKSTCHVDPPCVSECTSGEKRCDGPSVQLCSLLDDDCTHWVTETTCGSGTSCKDAACIQVPVCGDGVCWGESCGSCPADCGVCSGCSGGGGYCGGPGEYKCAGKCAYRCKWDDQSGQSTWVLVTDCAKGGDACQCALIDGYFYYCGWNGDPWNPCNY